MDMIAKYRQSERISNTINFYNDEKRRWKEEEIEKISVKMNTMGASVKKTVGFNLQQKVVIMNTPNANWLMWHYQKGKKTECMKPAEIRIGQIKKDAEQLLD